MCSSTGFQRHLAEEERVDYARSLLCEGASLLVQGQAAHSAITTRHLHQCLDKFDRALRLAPHLRAHAVRILLRGRDMGLSPIDMLTIPAWRSPVPGEMYLLSGITGYESAT